MIVMMMMSWRMFWSVRISLASKIHQLHLGAKLHEVLSCYVAIFICIVLGIFYINGNLGTIHFHDCTLKNIPGMF